ncbi:MAG: hypothetical protein GX662_13230 [Trichococcus flocculiformis]|uniref:DUF4145 domain-containing protein n=1 Tax=Trichococcus flocculiformis TaxID=82803 RepID=A0A847D8T8_9LACT|nr:hypothetical protein [Trichococcus flocculiformis]NLD33196.1 hypothetical protein [Trichococcus flocculiformis]
MEMTMQYFRINPNDSKDIFEDNCIVDVKTICPHCNMTGRQEPITGAMNTRENVLAITTECLSCNKLSTHEYFCVETYRGTFETHYRNTYPNFSENINIPEKVKQEYPDFLKILNQSQQAEETNLNELAGMGYRKALEFFVKEYVTKNLDEGKEKELILSEPLGETIKRLENPMLQRISKASSWLGNDQTHMVQKHPDYGIEDIKKYIKVMTNLVEAEYVADQVGVLLNKSK